MRFETLFANPLGRTPRAQFVPALLTLLAVVVFYYLLVTSRTGIWCQLVLLFPAFVLHARRLRDMGRSTGLLLAPLALLLAAFGIWLDYLSFGPAVDGTLPKLAVAVAAAFALWCSLGRSR